MRVRFGDQKYDDSPIGSIRNNVGSNSPLGAPTTSIPQSIMKTITVIRVVEEPREKEANMDALKVDDEKL